MPWVLLRTRNKNTGDRVNPHYSPLRGSAKSCQCSGFGGQRPPKHVQRPLNIFRSTWKCSEATKQLKTQLKTQLQTRKATLIKVTFLVAEKFGWKEQGSSPPVTQMSLTIWTNLFPVQRCVSDTNGVDDDFTTSTLEFSSLEKMAGLTASYK